MGYSTQHTLTARGTKLTEQTVDNLNRWLKDRQIINYALRMGEFYHLSQYGRLQDEVVFDCHYDCKWYEHETDMLDLSKAFPDLTFCLHGEGEKQLDVWDEYYLNGNMEVCRIVCTMPKPDTIVWIE